MTEHLLTHAMTSAIVFLFFSSGITCDVTHVLQHVGLSGASLVQTMDQSCPSSDVYCRALSVCGNFFTMAQKQKSLFSFFPQRGQKRVDDDHPNEESETRATQSESVSSLSSL